MKIVYCLNIDQLQKGKCLSCKFYSACTDPSKVKKPHVDGTAWKLELLLDYLEWEWGKDAKTESAQRSKSGVSGDSNKSVANKGEN